MIKKAYLTVAGIVGIGVTAPNIYNNTSILREREHLFSIQNPHIPKRKTSEMVELAIGGIFVPIGKGVIYGMGAPLSIPTMIYDGMNNCSNHHFAMDFTSTFPIQHSLAVKGKLIGIRPTDVELQKFLSYLK